MTNSAPDCEKLAFSPAEAALRLGVSTWTVYDAVRLGRLPALRLGKRIVIPKAALEQLLANPSGQREGGAA